MSINHFKSSKAVLTFAKTFFRARITDFRKDIAICMTKDRHGHHAYFPALIICIAFADLLSGLYAGTLRNHGLKQLKQYAKRFLSVDDYRPLALEIVYESLRHKVAHLAYAYPVFDTATKPIFKKRKKRRVAWTVYASKRSPTFEIVDLPITQFLSKTVRPWPMSYNCRIKVSVRSFQRDIIRSIKGPAGYLQHLESHRVAQERFENCMIEYYPQASPTGS